VPGSADGHHVTVADDVVDFVADLQHGGDESQDRDVAVRAWRQGNRGAVIDEVVGDQVADPL
jgi:hypothetical protein